MENSSVVEIFRGGVLESVHRGAIAVCDAEGSLLHSAGDTERPIFLRSAAKPFQALPLILSGAAEAFQVTKEELAVVCGSHAGSDRHQDLVSALQGRCGVTETDLQCGVHPPFDTPTMQQLIRSGERSSPLRNNCSGKHTGMLAVLKHRYGRTTGIDGLGYLDPSSELQQEILGLFAEFAGVASTAIAMGTDGCSAPNFAVPLRAAARAAARLFEPSGISGPKAAAIKQIREAMIAHPFFVAGDRRFDTALMEVGGGRWCSKIGAEGYQLIGIAPGVVRPYAVGVALKIDDGDLTGRAAPRVAVEVLRQLGALSAADLNNLTQFTEPQLRNLRGLPVGEIRASFTL
jgi:L-asparaginase II